MKFWIDNEDGDNFETFETSGHVDFNVSDHLDAMKQAFWWGYTTECGYHLHTEDGFILEIVDPFKTPVWQNQVAFEYGVLLEREHHA